MRAAMINGAFYMQLMRLSLTLARRFYRPSCFAAELGCNFVAYLSHLIMIVSEFAPPTIDEKQML